MTDTGAQGRPTLVLGGTGKTGRRVAKRLAARGWPTRIGSRSADPPFDWENSATWTPALDGVGAVYLSYQPDLAVPGAVDVVGSFAELAMKHGVRRLVLIAGRGEPEAEQATGPRLLTFTDAVSEIAKATGRDIRYQPVSIDEHAATLREHGVPAEVIDLLTYLFSEVLDGRNAHVTDGEARALGRQARDFADYTRDTAATGIWNPASPR